MDQLMNIVDEIYPAICKDNDERPLPSLLDALKERLLAESRSSLCAGAVLLRQCRIGLHASLALAKAIPAEYLRVLDLSHNTIDDCAIVALLQMADTNPMLQEFYLSSNRITVDGARELGRALGQFRQLAVLDLSNDFGPGGGARNRNSINGDGLRLLCDQLARSFSVASLRLADNQIGDRDAGVLAQVLRVNLTMTHLDLNRNRIGSRGAQLLFDALGRNRALRHLHLVSNGIGPEASRSIATMLSSNTTLVSLDLARNALGPAVPDLADPLMQNCSLVVLNLSANGIDDEGGAALAAVLARNPHLIQLHLGSNRIEDAGGIALAQALARNRVLNVLDLSGNDIRDAAVIHLAEALVTNTSLISLDLSSCKIADDGAVAIATAVGSNKEIGLRVLRLRDNYVANSAGQIIVDELQSNTSITTADFRGNRMEHAKLTRVRQICRRNLNHIRNQVPKKLKEHIDELNEDIARLEQIYARLTEEKREVNRALVQLAAINDDKMHWRLGQQVTRDELHKRLATEQQQLTEIKVKVAQKRAEIDANQTKFDQQLKTKTEQFDAERAQRMRMEDQVAAARDQLTSLQVAFDKSPDQIRAEIDKVRRDKLKHQVQMTTIRARYQTIQKGYADGEGIAEYLERARYSLLHPDTAPEFGAS